MANELYIKPETEINFQSAGGDVAILVGGVGAGTGRASAECELALTYTTPRPDEYRWTCRALWAGTPVVGETLDSSCLFPRSTTMRAAEFLLDCSSPTQSAEVGLEWTRPSVRPTAVEPFPE